MWRDWQIKLSLHCTDAGQTSFILMKAPNTLIKQGSETFRKLLGSKAVMDDDARDDKAQHACCEGARLHLHIQACMSALLT